MFTVCVGLVFRSEYVQCPIICSLQGAWLTGLAIYWQVNILFGLGGNLSLSALISSLVEIRRFL